MKRSCADLEHQIALYVEGDLGETEAAEVGAHLRVCERCSEFARELEESQDVLKSLNREPIDSARLAEIRSKTLQKLTAGSRGRINWLDSLLPLRWGWRYVSAAVIVTVGVAGLVWWSTGFQRSEENLTARRQASPGVHEEPASEAGERAPVLRERTGRKETTRQPTVREEVAAKVDVVRPTATPRTPREDSALIEQEPAPPAEVESGRRSVRVEQAIVDSRASSHGQVTLKLATNNPDIAIYWLMGENGD